MELNVVVISRLHLIRQSLMARLKPIGFSVFLFEDIEEFIVRMNMVSPDIIIIDGDGIEEQWKKLLQAIGKKNKSIIPILILTKCSIDQANEALYLGVGGIILKPFNPSQHIRKILEIISTKKKLDLKREYLRVYPDISLRGTIKYFDSESKQQVTLSIINVSYRGAMVRFIYPETMENFQPGFRVPDAIFSIGSLQMNISFMVTHYEGKSAGILFEEIKTNKNKFYSFIDTIYNNVLGTVRVKGRW